MKPLWETESLGYKIRNKEGLFSTGSMSPLWEKVGKTWNRIGDLKGHLVSLNSYNGYCKVYQPRVELFTYPEGCEVVTVHRRESEVEGGVRPLEGL